MAELSGRTCLLSLFFAYSFLGMIWVNCQEMDLIKLFKRSFPSSVHPAYRSQLSPVAAEICNGDGMLAHWYMFLGQFSVTFEYCPGAQHANVDGMSRQCGQCSRPDCPVSSSNSRVNDVDSTTVLLDQPLPHRRWETPWRRICCRSCQWKPRWRPRYWRNLQQICHRLDQIWTLLRHLGRMQL